MEAAVRFDCQLYVGVHGAVQVAMPTLSKPRRVARLEPISFEALSDPAFGKLLVALENIPSLAV